MVAVLDSGGYQFAQPAAEIPPPQGVELFVKGARYAWRAVGASWTGKCSEMLMLY